MRIVAEADSALFSEAVLPFWVEADRQNNASPAKEMWSYVLKDDDGNVVGGVGGYLKWGWCYVQNLIVSPEHRKGAWGTKLMEQAEAFAREKQVKGLWVTTLSFQAPDFYKKLGYVEFGRLDDCPPEAALVMLCKRF